MLGDKSTRCPNLCRKGSILASSSRTYQYSIFLEFLDISFFSITRFLYLFQREYKLSHNGNGSENFQQNYKRESMENTSEVLFHLYSTCLKFVRAGTHTYICNEYLSYQIPAPGNTDGPRSGESVYGFLFDGSSYKPSPKYNMAFRPLANSFEGNLHNV